MQVDIEESGEGQGGYAKEMSKEFIEAEVGGVFGGGVHGWGEGAAQQVEVGPGAVITKTLGACRLVCPAAHNQHTHT